MKQLTAQKTKESGWERPIHSCPVFPADELFQPRFNTMVTLDPMLVDAAWDRLMINTRSLEYQEMPTQLHRNFLSALTLSNRMRSILG